MRKYIVQLAMVFLMYFSCIMIGLGLFSLTGMVVPDYDSIFVKRYFSVIAGLIGVAICVWYSKKNRWKNLGQMLCYSFSLTCIALGFAAVIDAISEKPENFNSDYPFALALVFFVVVALLGWIIKKLY